MDDSNAWRNTTINQDSNIYTGGGSSSGGNGSGGNGGGVTVVGVVI